MPDNLRRVPSDGSGPGTYLVALGSKRSAPFSLPQFVAPFLKLRSLMAFLDLETVTALVPQSCIAVEIDDNGKVLHHFQDLEKKCVWPSEFEVHGGYLYIGSWRTPYVARAKLPRQLAARSAGCGRHVLSAR